jgi:hypothetical protein
MLKRRYVSLTLIIVLVIAGSFFYGTIKAESGRFKIYTDSVKIDLLEWASRQYTSGTDNPIEWGVKLDTLNLPFMFSPKANFLNVTDMWITVIATSSPSGVTASFDIIINGMVTITSVPQYFSNVYLSQVSTHITDTSVYNAITQGLNIVTFSNPTADLYIYRATIFIEYEYSAR